MSTMREEVYSKLHPFFEYLVDTACDNIERLEKDDDWIPVADELPSTDDDVLITYRDIDRYDSRGIAISSYGEKYFGGYSLGYKYWRSPFEYFNQNYEVIAWKPLPEIYNGD